MDEKATQPPDTPTTPSPQTKRTQKKGGGWEVVAYSCQSTHNNPPVSYSKKLPHLLHADHGKELLQEPGKPALGASRLALGAQRDELGESRGEILEEQLLVCRVLLHDLAEIWEEGGGVD